MYSPNRNPTELYDERRNERGALLRQEARNKRLARPLATLSTTLVVFVVFVGLASIAVGPGRVIDWVGIYFLPMLGILGVLIVLGRLLMWGRWKGHPRPKGLRQTLLASLVGFRECGVEGHVSLRRRRSIRS